VLPKPFDIPSAGPRLQLPKKLHRFRFVTGLRRITLGNDRLDLDGDDKPLRPEDGEYVEFVCLVVSFHLKLS
jgi:hypothetical protein